MYGVLVAVSKGEGGGQVRSCRTLSESERKYCGTAILDCMYGSSIQSHNKEGCTVM